LNRSRKATNDRLGIEADHFFGWDFDLSGYKPDRSKGQRSGEQKDGP